MESFLWEHTIMHLPDSLFNIYMSYFWSKFPWDFSIVFSNIYFNCIEVNFIKIKFYTLKARWDKI
jgi:hypothetical protein